MPLHPRKWKKRLENLDQKVNIVSEIASVKPKPITAKRKIDKMKFINEQTKVANENTGNLILGNFNFDPKVILNKRLIFDTTTMDEEIIIDRIIDAIGNPYNDEYGIEHKPGTNYFTLRLENGR